eukprot:3946416-Amphidinium_carterae.1
MLVVVQLPICWFVGSMFLNSADGISKVLERRSPKVLLGYASLQGDRALVLYAVSCRGLALQHASLQLRSDREVASLAVAQN